MFGSPWEEHSFFVSPHHDCNAGEIQKLHKFSGTVKKVTSLDAVSEMQTGRDECFFE